MVNYGASDDVRVGKVARLRTGSPETIQIVRGAPRQSEVPREATDGIAQHVERLLDQLDRGATAPSDSRQTPALERSRASVPLGHVPGASASSSTRPPSYLQTPRPPTVPASPIPQDSALAVWGECISN